MAETPETILPDFPDHDQPRKRKVPPPTKLADDFVTISSDEEDGPLPVIRRKRPATAPLVPNHSCLRIYDGEKTPLHLAQLGSVVQWMPPIPATSIGAILLRLNRDLAHFATIDCTSPWAGRWLYTLTSTVQLLQHICSIRGAMKDKFTYFQQCPNSLIDPKLSAQCVPMACVKHLREWFKQVLNIPPPAPVAPRLVHSVRFDKRSKGNRGVLLRITPGGMALTAQQSPSTPSLQHANCFISSIPPPLPNTYSGRVLILKPT